MKKNYFEFLVEKVDNNNIIHKYIKYNIIGLNNINVIFIYR